jgi:aminoglycoside 3-N-acetyltransferase
MTATDAAGGEARLIAGTAAEPATATSLVSDLGALGIHEGDIVVVHSSLSRLGWVVGGAQAVVAALASAVGPAGTITMPTHSGHLSDPSRWRDPPVPTWWIPLIRANLPAFDPRLTPTRHMGAVVECFRQLDGARRSPHPRLSFTAVGPLAEAIAGRHDLNAGLGPDSPVGRLYDLGAKVVLLGVDHASDTSLHLAEYRARWPRKHWHTEGSPVLVDGVRRWMTYEELAFDDSDFSRLGEAYAATGAETTGMVGSGFGRLCRQADIVDFAVGWIEQTRR